MIIIEYIRDKRNRKVGLICAKYLESMDKVIVGFSLCNVKKDKFKKDLALEIANKRMSKYSKLDIISINIPRSIRNKLDKFILRIQKYYKDKNFVDWVNDFKKIMKEYEE